MNIKQAFNIGKMKLEKNKIEEPILKVKLILTFILNVNKEYLIINEEKEINKKHEKLFKKYIKKLIKRKPIQHIIKKQEFMKLNFFVNKNVLIPRPDTEILVQEVIELAKKINKPKILDLCTGSGIIAISIFKNIKNVEILATDISKKAINVAKINALNNELKNKIEFLKSNLFKKINRKNKFDIIVSNPPYIKSKVLKKELEKELKKEPKIALNRWKRWTKKL